MSTKIWKAGGRGESVGGCVAIGKSPSDRSRFPARSHARRRSRGEHPTQIERQKVEEYFESQTEERVRVANISLSLRIVRVSRNRRESLRDTALAIYRFHRPDRRTLPFSFFSHLPPVALSFSLSLSPSFSVADWNGTRNPCSRTEFTRDLLTVTADTPPPESTLTEPESLVEESSTWTHG